MGINLVSIHSSPNDQMLWAIDSKWNVHVRIGITDEMPVGTDWEHVPGKKVSASVPCSFCLFSGGWLVCLIFSCFLNWLASA